MPLPQDPATVAARWVSHIGSSVDKIRQGVQSVTTSPTQSAAAAGQLWQQRVADPATLAKFQRSLQRVSLADWQNAMINKGIPRIASGAANAKDKFTNFLTQFLPFVANVANQVHAMPKNTLEDRINRAVAQIRGTAQFKRTGP
jgi:hypothetical protein